MIYLTFSILISKPNPLFLRRHFMNSKPIDYIALTIAIVGTLNWGLIGLFDFNLVATLFGTDNVITRIVYVLVGIAGIINIGLLFEDFDK